VKALLQVNEEVPVFKTIAIGLDGSDGAKQAIPFAVELARRDGAKLVLAHVEEDIAGKGGGPIHFNEDEIQAEIKRQAEGLTAEGVETTVKMTSVFLGGPARAIAKIADEADADLIVVGTRGQSAVVGVVLGSVAQRLLHLAHQPVLVVPEEARPKSDEAVGAGQASATT
jgi:nucleotide-binding universal stress UspA family protein